MNRSTSVLCTRCQDYSIKFPVYTKSGFDVICTYCVRPCETLQKLTTYEILARHLRFACHNDEFGCYESFLPGELDAHEIVCPYKQYKCEFCVWSGTYRELIEHYQSERIYNEHRFMIKRGLSKFLFRIDGEMYMLRTIVGDEILYYLQHIGWDKQDVIYNIKFNAVKIQNKAISYRFGSDAYEKCNVTIARQSIVSVKIEQKKEDPLLVNMNCPICLETMVPPIFQCVNGHSFCANCWMPACALCRRPMSNTRNFAMEKLIAKMNIHRPCKYDACNFQTNIVCLQAHEAKCRFRTIECPADACKWSGELIGLKQHLDQKHRDDVLETDLEIGSDERHRICFLFVANCNYKLVFSADEKQIGIRIEELGNGDSEFRIRLVIATKPGNKKISLTLKSRSFVQIPIRNLKPHDSNQFVYLIKSDGKYEVPTRALKDLFCHGCKQYLAYFPIHSNPDQRKSYCWNCTPSVDNKILECAYTLLAQNLLFPCRHPNCTMKLIPAELSSHENTCVYKLTACSERSCPWKGTASELSRHLGRGHKVKIQREYKNGVKYSKRSDYNEQLLAALTCCRCGDHMTEPIHQFASKYNVCKKCCLDAEIFIRNYALENLTSSASYPCKHGCGREFGCTEIEAHRRYCDEAPYDCPVDGCILKTRKTKLVDHIIAQHLRLFLHGSTHLYDYTEPSMYNCMLLQRESELFKLVYALRNRSFCFSVQYVGDPKECDRYYYCIQVPSGDEGLVVVEQNCAPWIDDPFEKSEHFTELPYALFEPYLRTKNMFRKILPYYINVFYKKEQKFQQ